MFMPEESDTSQPSPIIKATYSPGLNDRMDEIEKTHPLSARRGWLTSHYLHFLRPRNVPLG